MARTPSQRAIFDALLTRYDRQIADAFLAAINELRSSADIGRAIKAISTGDTTGLIAALHLDPAAFASLNQAIATGFQAGGTAAVDGLPILKDATGARFVIRFDPGAFQAAAWVRERGAKLVTRLVNGQGDALRFALANGLGKGQNPRTTALDIIGRLDRRSGKRVGGLIGLSKPQLDAVRAAQAELSSGDPALLRGYLTRKRRDKTWDRAVLRAIDEGHLDADTIQRAAGRYADRLLQLRGTTIARTESLTALHAGQDEAFDQIISTGAVTLNMLRDTWHSAGDRRVRHTHTVLNGETVAHGTPFKSPSGAMLLYPGDISLGAPAAEVIGCRCWKQVRVMFLQNLV